MRKIPEISGVYRSHFLTVPEAIGEASGIRVFGRLIKSLVFTTDVAIVRNINADAVISVYPFTPQPPITQAIIMAAEMPVFCGVGGGITGGDRVVSLAKDAEFQGALGVVVNAPTTNETIASVKATIDIPIVVTVVSQFSDIQARLDAGASILNVSGAQNTPAMVRAIRDKFPDVPIIATGGQTQSSILATINAGANAITYTPPRPADQIKLFMERYRQECNQAQEQIFEDE